MQYEENLRAYVNHLKTTSINFVFMTTASIVLKTTAKCLGNHHYLTDSPYTNKYYLYIYKASNVKYFMTEYQENTDHIRIINFRPVNSESELNHPYTANHGDHLTFGLKIDRARRKLCIDTHQTIYTFSTNERSIGFFDKALIGYFDACVFDFEPIVNRKYETFLKMPCSTSTTMDKAYKDSSEKRIIFHLVNKMANVDVPITPQKSKMGEISHEGGTRSHFEYKGLHASHDDFLNFIRSFFEPLDHVHVTMSFFYDPAYKNMTCFVDFDDLFRVGLIIHVPKALKACFAHYNQSSCSKRERQIMASFTKSFEEKIAKIKQSVTYKF